MQKSKVLIIPIFLLCFFIENCLYEKTLNEKIVIKIGEFTINQQLFHSQLQKLSKSQEQLTRKELGLIVLDNYISAGLLIEFAKKFNYENNIEYIDNDLLHRKQLIVEQSKYLRCKKNKISFNNIKKIKNYFQNDIKIDYIRIPREHKALSKLMYENLIGGARITDLLGNPLSIKWDSCGLSFYKNISVRSALLTDKVIHIVNNMKDNEVRIIKTKSAFFVIRFLQSIKHSNSNLNDNSIILNRLMSKSLARGDLFLDEYKLKKSIKCNEKLLSYIDFSIPPLLNKKEIESNIVAELYGQSISFEEIRKLIYTLPVEIQSLFRNKSTRKKAMATLILLNSYKKNDNQSSQFNHISDYKNIICNKINNSATKDTLELLTNWIRDEFEKKNTNSILEILNNKIKSCPKENKANNLLIKNEKNLANNKPEKLNQWLFPEKFPDFDKLSLNFTIIESMEIPLSNTNYDNKILANYKYWSITLGDFVEELNKLTPETRIEIQNNNLTTQMIKYIAKRDADINSELKINYQLLKSIDIIGNSFDLIYPVFKEDDLIGTLNKISISISELREMIFQLPEIERKKFLNLSSRRDYFNELIINKLWLTLYEKETIEDNPVFMEEIAKYKNWLLAELYYKSEIQIVPFETDDEKLNMLIRKAVKTINQERLNNVLQKAINEFPIYANSDILNNLHVNIKLSLYSSSIIKD